MTRGKLAGLFSLKAILLACFLTPVTVTTTGITAAQAQFQIIIPGFGYRGYGYRNYRRGYRYSRRSGRRGGGQQQQQPGSAEQQIQPTKNPTSGGVRPTSE